MRTGRRHPDPRPGLADILFGTQHTTTAAAGGRRQAPATRTGGRPCRVPFRENPRLGGLCLTQATGVTWLEQCKQVTASTGRSVDLQFGHVLVGAGWPKTVVPRRLI